MGRVREVVHAGGSVVRSQTFAVVVGMAEPGWNDLAFTTGVAKVLLQALGYEPHSEVLGINVIYEGMKNKDLDLFLGYWDPAMVTYYEPYKKDGSVENVRVNLVGANARGGTTGAVAVAHRLQPSDVTFLQPGPSSPGRPLQSQSR